MLISVDCPFVAEHMRAELAVDRLAGLADRFFHAGCCAAGAAVSFKGRAVVAFAGARMRAVAVCRPVAKVMVKGGIFGDEHIGLVRADLAAFARQVVHRVFRTACGRFQRLRLLNLLRVGVHMRRRNELDRCRRGERSGIEFAFVKRVVFQRSRNGLLRRRIPVISLRIPFHRDELHRAVLRLEAYRCRKPQICELRSHVLVRDGDCVVHLRQRELDCLNGKRRSCFGIEQAIFRLEDHGYFLRARFAVERFRLPVGELEGECTGKLGIRALNSGLAAGQRAGLPGEGSNFKLGKQENGVYRKLERAAIVQSFCPLEGRKLCDFRLSLYGRLHLDHKLGPNIRILRERDIVLPILPVKRTVHDLLFEVCRVVFGSIPRDVGVVIEAHAAVACVIPGVDGHGIRQVQIFKGRAICGIEIRRADAVIIAVGHIDNHFAGCLFDVRNVLWVKSHWKTVLPALQRASPMKLALIKGERAENRYGASVVSGDRGRAARKVVVVKVPAKRVAGVKPFFGLELQTRQDRLGLIDFALYLEFRLVQLEFRRICFPDFHFTGNTIGSKEIGAVEACFRDCELTLNVLRHIVPALVPENQVTRKPVEINAGHAVIGLGM